MRATGLAVALLCGLLLSCSSKDGGDGLSEVPLCPPGEAPCGNACVNLLADAAHCGACDNPCGSGKVCEDGSCVPRCHPSRKDCGGACFDLDSSDDHCGSCGSPCPEGMHCEAGSCVCDAGLELCDDVCVDTDASPEHCGACGVVCDADRECLGGVCTCSEGRQDCDGICVDVDSDPAHCGGCDAACAGFDNSEGGICTAGECVPLCLPGYADCDGELANGCEVDLESDPLHCGGCGLGCSGDQLCDEGVCVCPEGFMLCTDRCVDGLNDAEHCGACANACDPGEHCSEGHCCPEGERACNGVCVATDDDPENCGGCGLSCSGRPASTGGSCVEGSCELACEADTGDCNGFLLDGCETDLRSTREHCGACGVVCGARCEESRCLRVSLPQRMSMHTCIHLDNGEVYCWGFNNDGQLGNGFRGANVAQPAPVFDLEKAAAIATGDYHTCAVLQDGRAACWGKNDAGQLGTGNQQDLNLPGIVLDADGEPLTGVVQLVLTDASTCARIEGGGVKCWGANRHGRLGRGKVEADLPADDRADWVVDPSQPAAPLQGVVDLTAGGFHVCAALEDGSAVCWGANSNGQLGGPPKGSAQEAPAPVHGLTDVVKIRAGGHRTCALHADGGVSCWGQNLMGQVGDGSTTERLEPVPIPGLSQVVEMSFGPNHGCALREDGSAACWGFNNFGQLGDGTTTQRPEPVALLRGEGREPFSGLKGLAAGAAHTCVVTENDAVLCWGMNHAGQVGDGTILPPTEGVLEPTPIGW